MFLSCIVAASVVAQDSVEQTAQMINNTSGNIIGIGGIVATIVAMIVSSLVTWRVAKKSNTEMKLTYNMQIFPLFSNTAMRDGKTALDRLKIIYGEKQLYNPYLLSVDIANTGNIAINGPRIKIKTKDNISIIPGYFEDVPDGYEDIWKIAEIENTHSACGLFLEHINPGQVVHVRFFLDEKPRREIIFECPMPNLQLHNITENSYKGNNLYSSKHVLSRFLKFNILLGFCVVALLLSVNIWYPYLEYLFRNSAHIVTIELVIFVFGILICTLLFNFIGIERLDALVHTKRKVVTIVCIIVFFILLLLTILILFDIIRGFWLQLGIGVFAMIGYSVLLHLLVIAKS